MSTSESVESHRHTRSVTVSEQQLLVLAVEVGLGHLGNWSVYGGAFCSAGFQNCSGARPAGVRRRMPDATAVGNLLTPQHAG